MNFLEYSWLIPLFPALGSVLMLFFGRALDPQHPRAGHDAGQAHAEHAPGAGHRFISVLCPALVGLSFLFSLGAFVQLAKLPEHHFEKVVYTWIAGLPFHMTNGQLSTFQAAWGVLLDPLSGVMILVVSFVGFVIHVYSVGYMAHEGGYYRYFGYLNLFMFAMLTLVLANNYGMMFVGWEGVGLCSYLLIGFWFKKRSAADAGKKAFVVNRIGDAAFIIGMLYTMATFGTLNFTRVTEAARSGEFAVGDATITLLTLLFFVGATGKSAQIPLYVWLPDAMEGPTPVSALIHAATMVTAGVYMVARSNALFTLAPETMKVVAVVGALTAIFSASIGLVQYDIKRVLAYSTVSQLGYMFLACGVGAFGAGIFHLSTHAYFKALLFLGAGSVIHALGGEQDLRKMGALRDRIPWTYRCFIAAAVAIIGIFPFAGFFSKDEILWQAFSNPQYGSKALWAVAFLTAGMTAFYMWRLVFMTFFGESRVDREVEQHIHESPKVMLVPLGILAVLSCVGGFVGWPKSLGGTNLIEKWMAPVFQGHAAVAEATEAAAAEAAHSSSAEHLLMVLAMALAIVMVGVAYYFYVKRPEKADELAAGLRPVHTLLLRKYYVDEVYSAAFVDGPIMGKQLGSALSRFDAVVVDGGVNGAGWVTRLSSRLSIFWDTWVVDGAVNLIAFLTKVFSFPVRLIQTGFVQSYALVIVLCVLTFFGYYLLR
jgi:NADH-quinone oxidoreductase subunit L